MTPDLSAPRSPARGFDRSAIMTRAWELARVWDADARSFHYAQQQSRPRVALRLEAPAPFVGKVRAHFAEALRQAWAEARKADAAPETAEIITARREVIAARIACNRCGRNSARLSPKLRIEELTLPRQARIA